MTKWSVATGSQVDLAAAFGEELYHGCRLQPKWKSHTSLCHVLHDVTLNCTVRNLVASHVYRVNLPCQATDSTVMPPRFSPLFPQAALRIPVDGASTFLQGPYSQSLPRSLPTERELLLLQASHSLSRCDSKNRNDKNRKSKNRNN